MNLRIKGGRSFFYQWDSGQAVVVEHEGTIHEVHFAHKGDENALTVSVKTIENGVEANVPNILLQSAEDIFAYLVFRDEDGTETRKAVRIPVLARPKPETYVYTETEVLNYAYLDERLNALEGEGLANAVADYLEKNPPKAGATEEEAEQIAKNKSDIETLNREKLDASKLPEAVNEALAQAKASGEFKGEKGDPGEKGEKGDPGEKGADGQPGANGKDYVLTEADKQEIADMVEITIPDSGQNGNGLSTTAANLLIEILESAVYSTNVSGKIARLKDALAGGDSPDTPDEPDKPVVTDDITVADGIMTIVSVGSEITVSGGVMTIA